MRAESADLFALSTLCSCLFSLPFCLELVGLLLLLLQLNTSYNQEYRSVQRTNSLPSCISTMQR